MLITLVKDVATIHSPIKLNVAIVGAILDLVLIQRRSQKNCLVSSHCTRICFMNNCVVSLWFVSVIRVTHRSLGGHHALFGLVDYDTGRANRESTEGNHPITSLKIL